MIEPAAQERNLGEKQDFFAHFRSTSFLGPKMRILGAAIGNWLCPVLSRVERLALFFQK